MSFLTSLLPGVRELRTPLTACALWLAGIIIVIATTGVQVLPTTSATSAILDLVSELPRIYLGSAVLLASFLIGNVAVGTISPLQRRLGRRIQRALDRFAYPNTPTARGRLRRIAGKLIRMTASTAARTLAINAIHRTLSKAGATGGAVFAFPVDSAIETLPYTAAQLAQTAPLQYQEYDRLRAEADLRLAIVPPLLFLSVVVPLRGRLWFVAGAIVMAIVLYAQASSELRSADLILANAAYLELVTFPSVSSLAELLSNLDPQPKSQGEWMGAIVGGLALLGLFEESDHALKDLRCDAVAQRHDAAHPKSDPDPVRRLRLRTRVTSASDPEAPSLRVTSGRRSPTLLRRVFIRVGQGHRFPKWQRRHRVGSLEWIGNDYSCSLRWSWLWSPFSPPGDVMTGALSRRTPKRRYPEPTVGFRRAPPVCATT